MSSYCVLALSLLFLLFIINHSQCLPPDYVNRQGQLYGSSSLSRRQDDPLIPNEEEETTEQAPTLFGRARQGLQKFRENASDFWEGVRDQVSDWFDTDRR